MKLTSIIAATAVLSIACVGAANAQTGTKVEKPIAIKIGGFIPQTGSAKDLGSNWLAVGGEYTLGNSQTSPTEQRTAFVDYTSKSKDGVDARYTGVGLGTHTSSTMQSSGSSYNVFYGAGVGAYFQEAKVNGISKSGTTYGGKATIGLEFSQGLFVEGGYTWIANKINNVNLNGFNVYAGIRF